MSLRLIRICAFAILAELLFLVTVAQAQAPFTIVEDGVHQLFTEDDAPGDLYLHVENNTNELLYLHAELHGSPNFQLYKEHGYFRIPADSSAFTLLVQFWPEPGDTSSTYLVVTDMNGYYDTVEIHGFDARPDPPIPEPDAWDWSTWGLQFGSNYGLPDSTRINIRNKTTEPITMTASFLSGGYGIFLSGDNELVIPGGASHTFWIHFDSQTSDSGYAHLELSGGGEIDTLVLMASHIGDTLTYHWITRRFDKVLEGDTVCKPIMLYNHTQRSATISAIEIMFNEGFYVGSPQNLPVNLSAGDSLEIVVCYIAPTDEWHSSSVLSITSQLDGLFPRTQMIYLNGTTREHDSNSVALYGDQTRTLAFNGDSTNTRITYRFYNDQQDSLTILSVTLAQGTHFIITDVQPLPLPVKLGPGDDLTVAIQFYGTPGMYDDTLVIVTETGIVALRFPIEASITSSSVGRFAASEVAVGLSPNPSEGIVRIQVNGGKATSIEVLDMLGAPVTTLAREEATWDGSQVPAGIYFIRVTGVSDDTEPFLRTQRVVIE